MPIGAQTTADINADFVLAIINRAAHIVASSTPQDGENPNAYEALAKARDQLLVGRKSRQRTYGWTLLVHDLRELLEEQGVIEKDTWASIGTWSTATDSKEVATTLMEVAPLVSQLVRERTESATMFELMKPQHQQEHLLMEKAASFFASQGLKVAIEWRRGNPDHDPIDFRGTIDGAPWAFELKQLRSDPEDFHRKVGDPRERKSLKDQLAELEKPMPRIPDDAATLQRVLDNTIRNATHESKLEKLDGAQYCLVLHNQQFLAPEEWAKVTIPHLSGSDAVIVLHDETLPPAHVWEVLLQTGIHKPIQSQNLGGVVKTVRGW